MQIQIKLHLQSKIQKKYKRTDNEGCESQIVFRGTCNSANFGCFEALMIFRKGF